MKSRLLGAVCASLLITSFPAQAATLLGTGTLNNTDDLTIIEAGNGAILEWLDLDATLYTVAQAQANYPSFHWATGEEVAELFDAFGIPFPTEITPDVVTTLNIDLATAQHFIDFMGFTITSDVLFQDGSGKGALGWLDHMTTATYHTYVCISYGGCAGSFIYNTPDFWPETSEATGTFMVRNAVPIPPALYLFGSGLIGLVGVAKRRKQS